MHAEVVPPIADDLAIPSAIDPPLWGSGPPPGPPCQGLISAGRRPRASALVVLYVHDDHRDVVRCTVIDRQVLAAQPARRSRSTGSARLDVRDGPHRSRPPRRAACAPGCTGPLSPASGPSCTSPAASAAHGRTGLRKIGTGINANDDLGYPAAWSWGERDQTAPFRQGAFGSASVSRMSWHQVKAALTARCWRAPSPVGALAGPWPVP